MNSLSAKLLLASLAVGASSMVSAAPVTYDFTATINNVSGSQYAADAGTSVTGYFVLNSTNGTVATSNGSTTTTGSNNSASQRVFDFYVNLPNGSGGTTLFSGASMFAPGYDSYGGSGNSTVGYIWSASQGNGSGYVQLSIGPITGNNNLTDPTTGNLINTSNAVLRNGNSSGAEGTIELFGSSTNQIAGLDVMNITPVPLPASAWLMLGGLGCFGFLARRRGLV